MEEHVQDAHATLDVELPRGTSHITMEYSGGVSPVLPQTQPHLGDPSRTMKMIDMKLHGSTYTIDARVDSTQNSNFQLRTDRKILAVHGAMWKENSPEAYEITVPPAESSQSSHGYHTVQVVVDLGSSR